MSEVLCPLFYPIVFYDFLLRLLRAFPVHEYNFPVIQVASLQDSD